MSKIGIPVSLVVNIFFANQLLLSSWLIIPFFLHFSYVPSGLPKKKDKKGAKKATRNPKIKNRVGLTVLLSRKWFNKFFFFFFVWLWT